MAAGENSTTPPQISAAEHLDNLTSLQQPSAAEQSPITQSGEVRGDAPVANTPTPSPDNPSLFNEPKNPNNKVVEVESQKTGDEGDQNTNTDTASDQGGKITGDLSSLKGGNPNPTFTVQANGGGVQGDTAPEGAPGVNTSGGNSGNEGPTGGGGMPRTAAPAAPAAAPASAPTAATEPAPAEPAPSTTIAPSFSLFSAPVPLNSVATVSSDIKEVVEGNTAESLNTFGKIVVIDADAGESFIQPQANVKGAYGDFNIDANGNWTFTANSAYNELAAGERLSESFTVTSLDGSGSGVVTVNITGSNDLPFLSSSIQVTSVTETVATAGTLSNGSTFTYTDLDTTDTHSVTVTAPVDAVGTLTASETATGTVSWNYSVANSVVQHLAAGQTLIQDFTITVSDNHGGSASEVVTVTVVGTNEDPVLSSESTSATIVHLTEDDEHHAGNFDKASDTLAFTDVDLTDTHTVSVLGTPSLTWSVTPGGDDDGHRTLTTSQDTRIRAILAKGITEGGISFLATLAPADDSNGGRTGSIKWAFNASDSYFDFLSSNDKLSITYTVQVSDGHSGVDTETVTINIVGRQSEAHVDSEDGKEFSSLYKDSDYDIHDTYEKVSSCDSITLSKSKSIVFSGAIDDSKLDAILNDARLSSKSDFRSATVTLSSDVDCAHGKFASEHGISNSKIHVSDTTDNLLNHINDAWIQTGVTVKIASDEHGHLNSLTVDQAIKLHSLGTNFNGHDYEIEDSVEHIKSHISDSSVTGAKQLHLTQAFSTLSVADQALFSNLSNFDITPPAVSITGFSADSGVAGDHITNDLTPTIQGTAEASSTITVYLDGVLQGTTTANLSGNWSYGVTTVDGSHNFTVTATDAANNVSAPTDPFVILVDTAPPTVTVNSITADNIINATERTAGVAITGTNEAGATVTVNGHAATVVGTTWSYVANAATINAFNQGGETITIVATDAAGNPTTITKSFSVDTQGPTATVSISSISTDSGTSGDFITNDTSLRVYGAYSSLGSGESIQISSNGGSSWNDVSLQEGNSWRYTDSTNHNSSFTYQVRVVDSAGNEGSTGSQFITIDAVKPNAPTLAIISGADKSTAAEAQAGAVTVTGESNASIAVTFSNGTDSVTKTITGTGAAQTVTLSSAEVTSLASHGTGTITISASQTDVAGNTTVTPSTSSFILDTVAPKFITANITYISSSISSGNSRTVTIKFSEVINNFTAADLVANNTTGTSFSIGSVSTSDNMTYSVALLNGASTNKSPTISTVGFSSNASITDSLSNPVGFTSFTYLNPTTSIANTSGTASVLIHFSEEIASFQAVDIISKTSGFTVTSVTDSGDHINFTSVLTNTSSANKPLGTSAIGFSPTASIADAAGNAATLSGPIALDLNGDGIKYMNHSEGVTHDYFGTGAPLITAWVAPEDGLLASQKTDGTLNIVFSTQAGETDLQGLAKVYDTNHDNVFDAKDAGFNNFGVWQDANSDGIVQEGEFRTLADRGIVSLSLTSDGVIHTVAGGDVTIFGQTTYTMTDGSTGIAEDVAFAVSAVTPTDGNGVQDIYQIASVAEATVMINDFSVLDGDRVDLSAILHPADSVHSMISMDQNGLADSHSTITVNIGGVDYEVATLYGKEIGVPDALGAHAGGSALSDALHGASWTDVVDVSSDHGGPSSIMAAGGDLTNGYSNESGDWTVQIKSGTATVDAANKQINFTSDHAGNEAIITTADGTAHEISNVDKILWH